MKKIVLISYHSWNSKRKAGFHWLANSYVSLGYSVLFITASISILSVFYRDHRCFTLTQKNVVTQITSNLAVFPYFTILHPENYLKIKFLKENKRISNLFSIFDLLFTPLFKRYGKKIPHMLKEVIKDTDFFIFESTPGIMLFSEFRKISPKAKMIYRVSDDMTLLNHHRIVKEYENKILPLFDLISIPSNYMLQKLSHYSHVEINPHGIEKELFNKNYQVPYQYRNFEKNLVFVGCSYFDTDFLKLASRLYPLYGFHIIGPIKPRISNPNIFYYGEIEFTNTIPFIKHGDIGLQTLYSESPIQIFNTSLKIMQYTWCKLPILVPWEIGKEYPHFFPYKREKISIKFAINSALEFNRNDIDLSWIRSWDEVACDILKGADSKLTL